MDPHHFVLALFALYTAFACASIYFLPKFERLSALLYLVGGYGLLALLALDIVGVRT